MRIHILSLQDKKFYQIQKKKKNPHHPHMMKGTNYHMIEIVPGDLVQNTLKAITTPVDWATGILLDKYVLLQLMFQK